MKSWRSIIVDDEPLARVELARLLSKYEQITIIGEADSVPSAKNIIVELAPELIFLDIDLGKQTGFDLLEQIPKKFHVIFVTAFDEYAIRAFNVNALDYLLKPINPQRLDEAVVRLGNPDIDNNEHLLNLSDKILVNNSNCLKMIEVNSISYIEANGDYTIVNTASGFSGIIHHTIKNWLIRLPEKVFIQAHRSFIINLNHVKEFRKKNKDSFEVVFEKISTTVPVSRNFSKRIKSDFQ